MEETRRLLERLVDDGLINILHFLDEPGDLVRFAAASKTCQKRVVEGRCVKDLCIRISPEVSMFSSVEEHKININEGVSSHKDLKWENLEREHKVYTMLARELMGSPARRSCICKPIQVSSTDNYPDESVINTLDPRHIKDNGMPCYWSSKGESNVEVPETLTYALHTKLCVVHEVKIRPFKAYFQRGYPIYSSNAVRFRFGYCRSNIEDVDMFKSNNKFDYVWMYVSPEYTMQQADILQSFKLPRPVLCIGGILQVELLGRVQTQETDKLYYICVCHVHVVGRPLTFLDFEALVQPEQFTLKHSETQKCLCIASEDTFAEEYYFFDSEDDVIDDEEDDHLDPEDHVIGAEEDDHLDPEDHVIGPDEDDHLDSEDDVIGAEEDDHLDSEDDVIGAEEDDHYVLF
ncbi:hypothetical protein SUGI_0722010 [Cryptomeria japonica]|uniref:F-box protein At4g00755 n=1 Tax=Cryptomeria japonica TaxID=3369 RepID=UPI00241492CD|nr:F-box protein At4g00755 [Cryptomeria japonica]GLJ35997.1 hypothetical protein SUGI_0722010 [Cryptomeria japonica]